MAQSDSLPKTNEDLDRIWIGRQIRDLRKSKGISLAFVAEKTGKSIGYISQVERGVSSLPIPVLQSISSILGVNVTWFFHAGDQQQKNESDHVVRKGSRRHLNFSGSGIREEMLSPWLNGEFLMVLTTFFPGAESDQQPRKRKGEEGGYVKSGSLELSINNKPFILNAGDSFSISENDVYHARNVSNEEDCVLIWVMSPSSF